ncbi:MAG: TIGR02171 family protein [Fibrobacter sp.]|nr:TIGR02171 family protein [Fibrobacter sp.]
MKQAFAISLFALVLLACSNMSSDSSNDTPMDEIDGMIAVRGGTVTLGTKDSKFKPSERPAMKVSLDYDYYLAIHEFTCGEYKALAKEYKLKDFGKCKKDSLPLANVTYYDAVLIANAKNKSEKRDSAYTYTKATFDSEGHCTNLDALVFHPEVNAYRLPTEAEWVHAASKGWDPKNNSWNADNSDFKSHVICSAGKDSRDFCDLAGNVKEWVNDWAGQFRDTAITNYVGSLDGGDLGERVLKGGYFSDRPSEMNVIARGDEYTVEGSSHADRIGFRLAFGNIPNPVWLDASGKVQTSAVSALANASSIKKLTGTHIAILAFRNDISGNLAFIDYSEGTLSVKEIHDSIEVYHPDISPDGKRVAFCTKPEGISGTSKLYVRDLNAKGTNRVKLDVKSATIPRWRVLDNGDTAIVYVTDAGNNKDESAFKGSATWQVKFSKGKFGTPQKLFDGAYHGGISEDNSLAVSGARLLRARIAKSGSTITEKARDTIWYDKEQACNVSLAQDKSKRTLFLDFGGKKGQKFVDASYATHERIFIADSTGKLIQSIKSPKSYTFDHSEWASDGKTSNIVATLANANGSHTKIVLVSPADSSVTELAEGEELWHPNLWVERKARNTQTDETGIDFELDPDSAGIYFTTGGSSDAEKYRYKMQLLWQYRDSATVVFFGSSRIFHTLDPDGISRPHFAINMANDHNTLIGSFILFESYILPHVKKLKYVVVGTDADRLKYLDSFWDSEAWTYPGYVYDRNHAYWKDGVPKELPSMTDKALSNSKSLKETLLSSRGYRAQPCNGWSDSLPTVKGDSSWNNSNPKPFNKNVEILQKFAKLAAEKNIKVIALETPQNPAYQNTGAYGINGILRSDAPALLQKIQDISKDYPNFIFMDENKMGKHDYTGKMAYDDDHLGTLGAEKLTHRLDSLIKTLDIKFENKKEK